MTKLAKFPALKGAVRLTPKPLSYFVSKPLSRSIGSKAENEPLSQRQLIWLMMESLTSMSGYRQVLIERDDQTTEFPEWLDANWEDMMEEPEGVHDWARQFLVNETLNSELDTELNKPTKPANRVSIKLVKGVFYLTNQQKQTFTLGDADILEDVWELELMSHLEEMIDIEEKASGGAK